MFCRFVWCKTVYTYLNGNSHSAKLQCTFETFNLFCPNGCSLGSSGLSGLDIELKELT